MAGLNIATASVRACVRGYVRGCMAAWVAGGWVGAGTSFPGMKSWLAKLAKFGQAWPSLAKFVYVLLCLVMFGYVWVWLAWRKNLNRRRHRPARLQSNVGHSV